MSGSRDAEQVVEQQQILGVGVGQLGRGPGLARRLAVEVVDARSPARNSRATAWNGMSLVCDSQ